MKSLEIDNESNRWTYRFVLVVVAAGSSLGTFTIGTALFHVFGGPNAPRLMFSTVVGIASAWLLSSFIRINRLYRDALTGAYRREIMIKRLQATNRRGVPVIVAFIDLNNLGAANNRFGHDVGDQLIQQLAKRLLVNFGSRRNRDSMVARSGGDEFVVVSTRCTDLVKFRAKLIEVLTPPFRGEDPAINEHFKTSIGVAGVAYSHKGNSGVVLANADMAMYRAKEKYHETGEAQVMIYDPWLDGHPMPVRILQAEIRRRKVRDRRVRSDGRDNDEG